jgi:hypothetical protein
MLATAKALKVEREKERESELDHEVVPESEDRLLR